MSTVSAPIETIVLGVDDGEYSWDALDMARRVAKTVGAEVHPFHAATDHVSDELVHRASEAQVRLRSAPTVAGSEGVARCLVDYSAGLENAVAAVTSHARRGLTATLLGSAAAAVLELSDEPVLLFGPHHEGPGTISRVLACVDGSKLSESILPAACRWARAADVALWLVHVVEPAASAAGGGADSNYIHRIAEDIDTSDLDVEFDVLHGNHPGRAIADYANTEAGTLTALATHGRSGLRAITMGSVATEVTRRSKGPTLAMRPS